MTKIAEDRMIFEIKALITRLYDKMDNLEDQVNGFYKEFIEYMEHNPKADEQWAEERLRALEHQVKELKDLLKDELSL